MIEMRHNGLAVGDTAAPIGLLHVHATLKLKAGDKISIFKATAGDLYTDLKTPDTHFSGWLMEEYVSIVWTEIAHLIIIIVIKGLIQIFAVSNINPY